VTSSLTPNRNSKSEITSKEPGKIRREGYNRRTAYGPFGGKRRTMKAKKYLKKNRKKTIRKNKKTIKKTIRKNKKTRKIQS
jgi:hypothetical protein